MFQGVVWDCWARNVEIVCIRSWRFAHDKDAPQKMTDLNGIIFFPYGKMASHSWHMLKHWVGSSARKKLDMQKILGCPLFPVKQHLQQQRIRPLEKPSRNGYVWRMAALGTVGNFIWKPCNWIQIMPSKPRILGIFFHGNLRGPPPIPPTPRSKALLRAYFLGGWHWGGPLGLSWFGVVFVAERNHSKGVWICFFIDRDNLELHPQDLVVSFIFHMFFPLFTTKKLEGKWSSLDQFRVQLFQNPSVQPPT